MRVPQPDIIEHFGNADAVPQPPERCLSRQAGIVRCCLNTGNAAAPWMVRRHCSAMNSDKLLKNILLASKYR